MKISGFVPAHRLTWCMTVSVPDCFGPGTEMVTLITVSVPHDRRFGPARSD